jgi:hypothetical protein
LRRHLRQHIIQYLSPPHANGPVFISASSLPPPLVFSLWKTLLVQVLRENILPWCGGHFLSCLQQENIAFVFENIPTSSFF